MPYIIFFLSFILMFDFANAHEFGGRERNKLKNELIQERANYDNCIKKSGLDEDVLKNCRQDYAKQRLFSVEELFHFYTEHAIDAEDIYTNLHIAVKGKVHRIGKSGMGFPEIIFSMDAFGLTGVRCEFANDMTNTLEQLELGSVVVLGGISKGMLTDNYVRLTHCEFLEAEKNTK